MDVKLKHLKLILASLLAFVLVFSFTSFADETENAEEEDEITLPSDYACVYNVESDEMLYERGADTIIYPGSLVKIMTAALALESYEYPHDSVITVTESALAEVKGNNIKLKPGEKLTFYDLVAAVSVGGANDAAYVLAEVIAGSSENFIGMMNEKAKSLGALNTQFANPTGYHSPRMYTTLSDLALICKWANKNKDFMEISSLISYTVPKTEMSAERTLTNANLFLDPRHWLRHYKEGVSGMNAGMTYEAGYTLAAAYNNDGQTNIVIIVGGKVDSWDYQYFKEASKLLDITATSFEYRKIVSRNEPVFDVKVLYGTDTDHVLLATETEVKALLPKDAAEEDIVCDYTIVSEECMAPVKKGTQMGSYNVYYKGELVSTVPLVTQGTIKRDNFSYLSGQIKAFFEHETVKSVILLVLSVIFMSVVIAFIRFYYKRLAELRREQEIRRQKLSRARRTLK